MILTIEKKKKVIFIELFYGDNKENIDIKSK